MTEITDIHYISGTCLRNSLLLSPLIQQDRYYSFSPERDRLREMKVYTGDGRTPAQSLRPSVQMGVFLLNLCVWTFYKIL